MTKTAKTIRRTKTGVVTSNKMDKTVVVKVDEQRRHPVYHKGMTVSKKYHAHTEKNIEEGAKVTIAETKPLSKTKSWEVTKVHTS